MSEIIIWENTDSIEDITYEEMMDDEEKKGYEQQD